MRVAPLGRVDHPDFNDVVIHFTGRRGVYRDDARVRTEADWGRLKSILRGRELLGFSMPGTGASAVCFTEATAEGCSWLIKTGRYTSCGVAFHKPYLFEHGGGPVLQVRGDEWAAVARWPESLRARAVRLWPGAAPASGESLPWWLAGRSEWLYEREWRVPVVADGLQFDHEAVAFLVLPSTEHLQAWVAETHRQEPELAQALTKMRYIVLDETGVVAANGVSVKRSSRRLDDR